MRGVEAGRSPGLVVHLLTILPRRSSHPCSTAAAVLFSQIEKKTNQRRNRAQWSHVAGLSGHATEGKGGAGGRELQKRRPKYLRREAAAVGFT
jgi:hypothetical protein